MSAATDGSRPMVSVIGAITLGMMVGFGIGLTVGYEMLGYGQIAEMRATLAEMNDRQKSVVVKQHDAITAALTAEIHKAVEEMKGGAR